MTVRKGSSLIELLVVMAVLSLAAGLTGPMFRVLVREIPRSSEAIEADRAVRRMLERLCRDVDAARGLPRARGAHTSGKRRLLVELPGQTVCYEIDGDTVVRKALGPGTGEPVVWHVPGAKINWRIRREGDRGVGVEVSTWIERRIERRTARRLANAHVFFVGAGGPGVPAK